LLKGLTVLVPAWNEAESVGDTVRSLLTQTRVPTEVVVIDDCSTDDTAAVAEAAGARVIRTPANTGSKAGAQNFALPLVATEFVMAIDADTTLAPDAIEKLAPAFDDDGVSAACGFVLPRHVRTVWERGRYIEYLFAFTFYKQVQDFYGRPMISSGCFSMYRTDVLRSLDGWPTTTLAEDMDLTWRLYQAGQGVRFVPEAVSYPIEPADFHFLSKQLRRWSHGFVQNVRLHWRGLLDVPYLRSAVAVATWDAIVASVMFLFVLPLLALLLKQPWLLLGYIIDLPALLVPLLAGAVPRREVGRALASLPAFFLMRTVNGVFFVRAAWAEWVLRRPLLVYEKGH
jgi:poly-beta-1,6-N-acetyl-D-glucosamine synthase